MEMLDMSNLTIQDLVVDQSIKNDLEGLVQLGQSLGYQVSMLHNYEGGPDGDDSFNISFVKKEKQLHLDIFLAQGTVEVNQISYTDGSILEFSAMNNVVSFKDVIEKFSNLLK